MSISQAVVQPSTDLSMLCAAQTGSSKALEELLHRYTWLVRSKARGYFLRGADRDDVLQEGMIGLYKAIRDFDVSRGDQFRVFAALCISRQIITAVKSASRKKHYPLNSCISITKRLGGFDKKSVEDTLADRSAEPETLFISDESRVQLVERIRQELSDFEFQVLSLRLHGVPWAEIAERLDRPYKAVDNAVWRVKQKLRRELALSP